MSASFALSVQQPKHSNSLSYDGIHSHAKIIG
jgi:hypothetical protein